MRKPIATLATLTLLALCVHGCTNDDNGGPPPPLVLTLSSSDLSNTFTTSNLATCLNGLSSVNLDNIQWTNPDLAGHKFSWKVQDDQAEIYDETASQMVFEAVLASEDVTDDEVNLPAAGVTMNATSTALSGTLTATGSVKCAASTSGTDAGTQGTQGTDAGVDATTTTGAACSAFDQHSTTFSPAGGPNGTPITIKGSGFSGAFTVSYQPIAALLENPTAADQVVTVDSTAHIVSDTEIAATLAGGRSCVILLDICTFTDVEVGSTESSVTYFYAPPSIATATCYQNNTMTTGCTSGNSGYVVLTGLNFYGATSAVVSGGSNNDLVANAGLGPSWRTSDENITAQIDLYTPGATVTVTTPGGTATGTLP